jgi:hypothetical protein
VVEEPGSAPGPAVGPPRRGGRALGWDLPDGPSDPVDVVSVLADACEPGLTAMPAGRLFGFVIGGTVPAALAADWLVSAWDRNSGRPARASCTSPRCWTCTRAAVWASRLGPITTPSLPVRRCAWIAIRGGDVAGVDLPHRSGQRRRSHRGASGPTRGPPFGAGSGAAAGGLRLDDPRRAGIIWSPVRGVADVADGAVWLRQPRVIWSL